MESGHVSRVNGKFYEITMNDVMHVPGLRTNLFSICQLIKNGNNVKFLKNDCKICNVENELVAMVELLNNVYRLNVNGSNFCVLSANVHSEIWHCKVGHINSKDLCYMQTCKQMTPQIDELPVVKENKRGFLSTIVVQNRPHCLDWCT